jgi:hypothetical protein
MLQAVLNQKRVVKQMNLAVTEQDQETMLGCPTADYADRLDVLCHIELDAKVPRF